MADTVSICMPCGGPVNPKAMQCIMAMINYSAHHGVNIEGIGITDRVLITTARTILAKQFMDETKSEWSLWLDDDMMIPSDALVHLLELTKRHDAKIVSAMYYQRLPNYKPVCFRNIGEKDFIHVDPKKFSEVDGIGFGCVLVHRSVFDKIGADSFRFEFYEGIGQYMGEDIFFCKKAKKAGFRVYVDGNYVVGHIGAPEIVWRR